MSRIAARRNYWREFPPTHILVRSIAIGLGVFKPETTKPKQMTADDIAELKAVFGG